MRSILFYVFVFMVRRITESIWFFVMCVCLCLCARGSFSTGDQAVCICSPSSFFFWLEIEEGRSFLRLYLESFGVEVVVCLVSVRKCWRWLFNCYFPVSLLITMLAMSPSFARLSFLFHASSRFATPCVLSPSLLFLSSRTVSEVFDQGRDWQWCHHHLMA